MIDGLCSTTKDLFRAKVDSRPEKSWQLKGSSLDPLKQCPYIFKSVEVIIRGSVEDETADQQVPLPGVRSLFQRGHERERQSDRQGGVGKVRDTIAFVMAGGRGARLMPLTGDRSKPAVPFGGLH